LNILIELVELEIVGNTSQYFALLLIKCES